MEVKVLGGGCANCIKLADNTKKALEEMNIEADIIKVTEMSDILKHGVMSTPALVIDGKIVASGRVLTKREVVSYIESL
ncbi:MAG: TM0996/MTH895 family glutaredoxin-like protein [Clostridia bacterium]|nr:TM0996/MTH895 family glutaredoxin-like protein [Clostridia bacterium]